MLPPDVRNHRQLLIQRCSLNLIYRRRWAAYVRQSGNVSACDIASLLKKIDQTEALLNTASADNIHTPKSE